MTKDEIKAEAERRVKAGLPHGVEWNGESLGYGWIPVRWLNDSGVPILAPDFPYRITKLEGQDDGS